MNAGDRQLQVEITINRNRGGRVGGSQRPEVPEPPRIPRLARLMALAIKFQDMVDLGEVRDYADLARLGYVTRARLTQIMNLMLLAPDIQERILDCSAETAMARESAVRRLTKIVWWQDQRRALVIR